MGLQLIFVVETNKKCNSDWIYIKDTIEHFYSYERTQIKFSVVYMEGKWKYDKKEKQINNLISQYKATSENNRSKVIFCFDCDDYDINQGDADFLKKAKKYCDNKISQYRQHPMDYLECMEFVLKKLLKLMMRFLELILIWVERLVL